MEKVEQKNLKVQVGLAADILRNYSQIEYYIQQAGKTIFDLLCDSKVVSGSDKKVSLDIEKFNELMNHIRIIKDKNWDQLSSISKECVIDNRVKIKIFTDLRVDD